MLPCPRRAEAPHAHSDPVGDRWREDKTCSFCGSLSPEAFFGAIETGYQLIPTDKNYKAYVMLPNPLAGKTACHMSAAHPMRGYTLMDSSISEMVAWEPDQDPKDYVGRYVKLGTHPQTKQMKFYFHHFDDADKDRFIELLNTKKVNVGYPGFFYRFPFFMMMKTPAEDTELRANGHA